MSWRPRSQSLVGSAECISEFPCEGGGIAVTVLPSLSGIGVVPAVGFASRKPDVIQHGDS